MRSHRRWGDARRRPAAFVAVALALVCRAFRKDAWQGVVPGEWATPV